MALSCCLSALRVSAKSVDLSGYGFCGGCRVQLVGVP